MPAQNSIYANQLTNVPTMRFKMGSQNSSLFIMKNGGKNDRNNNPNGSGNMSGNVGLNGGGNPLGVNP